MKTPDPSCWKEAMLQGDFESAWLETDRVEIPRRLKENQGECAVSPGDGHLRWNGKPFKDKRVLVACEHGLGDTIQFSRYFPLLRKEAAHVIAKVQPALLDLFQEMPGVDSLIDAWTDNPDPEHDVSIECMELAYAFRSTAETIPAPCLPMDRLGETAFELKPGAALNIGLLWAASWWDPRRSITLDQLAPLDPGPGIRFYSLQQGSEAADAIHAPFALEPLSPLTREISAAARAMLAMDLIITVDGMPAHLAASLGRPTWMLLPYKADWRWMRDRTNCPWYPAMRLFRQPAPGDWETPIKEMAQCLKELELGSNSYSSIARQRR